MAVLTKLSGTANSRRMGRPPLGIRSTNVRISEEVRKRIRVLVGDKGMAQFIREAIDHELEVREKPPKKTKTKTKK